MLLLVCIPVIFNRPFHRRLQENGDELERLLSLPAVSRLQTQAEVKRAIEVNRLRQQQAVKAATPKSADDARRVTVAIYRRRHLRKRHS